MAIDLPAVDIDAMGLEDLQAHDVLREPGAIQHVAESQNLTGIVNSNNLSDLPNPEWLNRSSSCHDRRYLFLAIERDEFITVSTNLTARACVSKPNKAP
jgi:hypothetical protein